MISMYQPDKESEEKNQNEPQHPGNGIETITPDNENIHPVPEVKEVKDGSDE